MSERGMGQGGARVFLVEAHPEVRHAFGALLAFRGFTVCGEAAHPADAWEALAGARPDLVVVDLPFDPEPNLALLRTCAAARPDLPLLAVSLHEEATWANRALAAGAWDFLPKREAAEGLVAAVADCLATAGARV